MALAGLGPWNDITPEFFTSAMARGASLGLSARAQDAGEAEAADRLKLAYEQLGSKERLAAAQAKLAQQHQAAQMLLDVHKLKETQDYHQSLIDTRNQDIAARLQEATGRTTEAAGRLAETKRYHDFEIGKGSQKLDPITEADVKDKVQQVNAIDKQLMTTAPGTDAAVKLMENKLRLKGELYGIRQKYLTPKAAPSKGSEDTGELVEVTNPSGKRVRIKKSQLDDALNQGYKQ